MGWDLDLGVAWCNVGRFGNTAYVALSGDLDDASTQQIGVQLLGSIATSEVVVDLAEVTFFGVAALRMLGHLKERFGRGLTIISPSPAVKRVLELTGNEERFFVLAER